MDRSLTCLISGNKYTFSQSYFDKKVEEYGDVQTLKNFFVTKKVKSLIQRGYSAEEMRNILSVEESDLISANDSRIQDIISYHTLKNNTATRRSNNLFTNIKSDPDVSEFVQKIKALERFIQ